MAKENKLQLNNLIKSSEKLTEEEFKIIVNVKKLSKENKLQLNNFHNLKYKKHWTWGIKTKRSKTHIKYNKYFDASIRIRIWYKKKI